MLGDVAQHTVAIVIPRIAEAAAAAGAEAQDLPRLQEDRLRPSRESLDLVNRMMF